MKKFLTIALIYLLPFCLLVYLLVHAFSSPKTNVYTKIAQGQPISILIAGDSIGSGTGAKNREHTLANRLKAYLQSQYSISVSVVNVSMGGNTSYAEYVRVSRFKSRDFDLVILCCGENDAEETLGKYYESLIRAVKTKWPNCEIISVLQSSQKEYTQKIETIRSLANHYAIKIADTIEPFTNGQNGNYDSLTADGVHPNDKGYAIYANILENIIDAETRKHGNTLSLRLKKPILPPPLFPASLEFSNFQEIPTNSFTRNRNEFIGNIDIPQNAHIGIDIKLIQGNNYYELTINENSFIKKEFHRNFATRRHILELSEYKQLPIVSAAELRVTFKTNDQADSFKGLFISSPLR